MNEWEVAAVVLGFALVPCLGVCVFSSDPTHGLVSLQLGGVLLTTILMLLAEGFRRQPFIDLAVVMAPMSLVGAILFARLMEREL
jgi:multisubunit Na+/H+ antiporter MnhF subunit